MRIVSMLIFSIMILSSGRVFAADVLIVTTDSVPGKDCTIIDTNPAFIYQQFESFSFKGDPMEKATISSFEKITAMANKYGANTILGFRLVFGNRTEKDEGRVFVYGTMANCK